LEFSGFVGRDCLTEEDRLRRELASLGLNVGAKLSPKKLDGQSAAIQHSGPMKKNIFSSPAPPPHIPYRSLL